MSEEQKNPNGHTKLAWSLREAAQSCSVSVDYLRKEINNGRLHPRHRGRRVLIPDEELKRWLYAGAGESETAA